MKSRYLLGNFVYIATIQSKDISILKVKVRGAARAFGFLEAVNSNTNSHFKGLGNLLQVSALGHLIFVVNTKSDNFFRTSGLDATPSWRTKYTSASDFKTSIFVSTNINMHAAHYIKHERLVGIGMCIDNTKWNLNTLICCLWMTLYYSQHNG